MTNSWPSNHNGRDVQQWLRDGNTDRWARFLVFETIRQMVTDMLAGRPAPQRSATLEEISDTGKEPSKSGNGKGDGRGPKTGEAEPEAAQRSPRPRDNLVYSEVAGDAAGDEALTALSRLLLSSLDPHDTDRPAQHRNGHLP